MVTFAQAQERAERWINGGVPSYQHREVRVREFDLGFVAWAEDRETGPTSDGGNARLVIARDSGDSTLWPSLPVGEVIRRYEEEYGQPAAGAAAAAPEPPRRVDLEATSFLLTPPEWLQEAADRMGVPDHRQPSPEPYAPAPSASASPASPAPSSAPPSSGPPPPSSYASAPSAGPPSGGGSPWADTSGSGSGESVAPPATVFAPPISGSDEDDAPPPPSDRSEAKTELLPEGSALPSTKVTPALEEPEPPQTPEPPSGGGVHHAATMLADPSQGGQSAVPPPPPPPGGAADIADADTSRAPRGSVPSRPSSASRPSRGSGPAVPPPPGAPGTPGARPGAGSASGAGASSGGGSGYVPTQMVSADELASQAQGSQGSQGEGTPPPPSNPDASSGGGMHHAATMLAGPSSGGQPAVPPPSPPGQPGAARPGQPAPPGPPGRPGQPGPPSQPGQPGGGAPHHAATMLAGPGGPATPPPPQAPGAPHAPGAPPPGVAPPAYGYPQQPQAQPTVGPGYMAVLRYRAPDGSEQQLIRRSAPGTPHPEWQIMYELRGMNVPPQQVLELHTELESCDLPGGYCGRMIRETWPQVRISHTAPYGHDHGSRQQGVRHLIEHQGELHQVADGPARPAPVRAPLPQVQPAPPIPPDGVGQELAQAFGPQLVFRFDQRAVSRQGVPDVVAQILMWAGLPVEFGPFFWAQAQPGRPVPTLAELAQERGVQPASDAGSYLVMGSDFGRQLCVQYGTANIVAVPVEAGPGGQPAPPQFVNTGLPEFVRCLALLGRMWRLRFGLNPEQAGRWTVDFQAQLAALDPAALANPENWWAVLLEQMWDGLL